MKPRAARAALLCAVLLVVAGTAFCADGKQRSSAFVIDDDSDDESEDAGAPRRRVVQSNTTKVCEAPAQPLPTPAQPLQQACPCTPVAGVPRVYFCCVSGRVLANSDCVATGCLTIGINQHGNPKTNALEGVRRTS